MSVGIIKEPLNFECTLSTIVASSDFRAATITFYKFFTIPRLTIACRITLFKDLYFPPEICYHHLIFIIQIKIQIP